MTSNTEPVRKLECQFDDNGHPSWYSSPSHKNIQVRGGCDLPPHLPGIVILVHGVNSTGEWYQSAEISLCNGLNKRLGLEKTFFELKENVYSNDGTVHVDNSGKIQIEPKPPLTKRELIKGGGRSPVIRFYWGYASSKGDEDKYVIPLANKQGIDYHQLERQALSHEDIMAQGPFFWGGGPFQNGTNNLHSLWSEVGFDEHVLGILKSQWFNEDEDRLLTTAPPRKYYAHAANRLASLLDDIREKYPKDTVSIISHSQGTMIALAATAIAKKGGPDALFILNSPYALQDNIFDALSLPENERISPAGRESTLSSIIDKVAARASHLSDLGYDELCVGRTADNKNWRPDSQGQNAIAERDNHGRTYIYFCPHDRVMGSAPLRSVGWQGLPNDSKGAPNSLLERHKGHLFQRMLARSTPCGDEPNPLTPFGTLPDGKPFWDDAGDQYQSSSITYPDPPPGQTVFINAEKVPDPITVHELVDFDSTRVGEKHDSAQDDGWGEVNPKTKYKNDNTYDNYINLYPNQNIIIGFENKGRELQPHMIPKYRKETFEEKDRRIRAYVSQPTDHSTLPGNAAFMSRVVAYDLPIGYCEASWDKSFMTELRRKADWTLGEDAYLFSGVPDSVVEPDLINRESMADVIAREQATIPAYRAVNKA